MKCPHLKAGIPGVSLAPVLHQLLPTVELSLVTEQVEVGHTEVAVVELVFPAEMFVQLGKRLERDARADGRLVAQQLHVAVLDLLSLETYLVLPVHRVNVVLDVLELELGHGEDDHGHVLPADGALVLLTENSHPGAAEEADGVVTPPHAEHGQLVHTDLAAVLLLLLLRPLTFSRLANNFPLGGNITAVLPTRLSSGLSTSSTTSRLFIAIRVTFSWHLNICSEIKNLHFTR